MDKNNILIDKYSKIDDEKPNNDISILKKINNYAITGFKKLNEISKSELAFLSNNNQNRIYLARCIYMNIISEIEKAETIERLKGTDIKECAQSVKIEESIDRLCEKINSTVGNAANIKMKFIRSREKDISVLTDYSVFRFIFLNIVSLIAMNIENKKKIINVQINRNTLTNRIFINIWNKFSFKIKDKVTDVNKAFEMYSREYEFEQTVNISKTLARLMDGDVSYILDEDVLKIFISVPECAEKSEFDISLMEKSDYEASDEISILSTFVSAIIENCIEKDSEIMDISEIFNI